MPDERRRMWELFAMISTTILLVALSRLETRLFELSKSLSANSEFFTSVVYFGLINLNVIFILVLAFLIFRNVAKLVIDRRRGVLGSRLRTKLVVTLVFFAVAPTVLMFYISSRFITTSFDTWFSVKVRDTMQQTREAGAQVYKQDQRRLESLARIALQRVRVKEFRPQFPGDLPEIDASRLRGFESEYRLEGVRVYDRNGALVYSSFGDGEETGSEIVLAAIAEFDQHRDMVSKGVVDADDNRDAVKGVAPIYFPMTGQLVGVVVTEEHFETQILKSIEAILTEFANLRPGAQLIRLSYLILLVVMVMIIVFSTTWLGFYVARGIVGPIQRLAEATKEIALGNYNVNLQVSTDDETGTLVKAFNKMTVDLRNHEERNARFTRQLQLSNEELNRRRQYMEVVLKNITAGVISVDSEGIVTSFNSAAEKLLDISGHESIGMHITDVLGEDLAKLLWDPVIEKVEQGETFAGQISLSDIKAGETLLMAGTRITDEQGRGLGTVLVFDDATEQAKAQRVAAWREVARRIAHEIKNPITPIKLNAQRLLRRYRDKFEGEDREVFETCIESIITQVDSLRDLVNEFSKFSRMPAINAKPADLNELVWEVKNLYAMSYPNIEFKATDLGKDLPQVKLDRDQFNRVLMNLVANAVAAVEDEDDPLIEFRTEVVPSLNAVRLEILDSGKGIPAKEKDKVFEPYYSTKPDGTGLGLAIVSQIVSDHGGYIRIADNQLRGTKVVVELPWQSAQEPTGFAYERK